MKNSALFKIFIIISVMLILTILFFYRKKEDNRSNLSKEQISELEDFISIFTVKPVLSDYSEGGEEALLYFTVYHLIELKDDSVRYDEQNNEYVIPKLAIDEKVEEYFGIVLHSPSLHGSGIWLRNEEYHVEKYFQSGGGYAKIESVSKRGDELLLNCYTTDSDGKRHKRPTDNVDGGPILYNFTVVVGSHEYNGDKTWKLIGFQRIEYWLFE